MQLSCFKQFKTTKYMDRVYNFATINVHYTRWFKRYTKEVIIFNREYSPWYFLDNGIEVGQRKHPQTVREELAGAIIASEARAALDAPVVETKRARNDYFNQGLQKAADIALASGNIKLSERILDAKWAL